MVLGIRCLQKQDIPEVLAMIKKTIKAVPPTFYDGIQLTAWAETIQDIPSESDRFLKAYSLVATENGQIIGFASLVNDHHVDFLYVKKGRQGEGIATALLDALELEAAIRGVDVLTTDSSAVAESFFQKRGYQGMKQQTKWVRGISLKNVQMFKNVHN